MIDSLVSVLLPVKNGEKFVGQAIESILSQTHLALELIIVNDGSTDDTRKVVERYQFDQRVKIYNRAARGISSSLNYAARQASGMFLARQDADDLSLRHRFEVQLSALVGGDYDLVSSRTFVASKNSVSPKIYHILPPEFILPFVNHFVHGSWLMTKSWFDHLGGYDETLKASQDYDFLLRTLSRAGRLRSLAECLYVTQENENSISVAKRLLQGQIARQVRKKYWSHKFMPKNSR